MDSDGMRYGLTRKAWTSRAATIAHSATRRYSASVRLFIGPSLRSQRGPAAEGPVDDEAFADDIGTRDRAPEAAVVAVRAVVAHDEVRVGRYRVRLRERPRLAHRGAGHRPGGRGGVAPARRAMHVGLCLLYTSDAADDLLC